MKIPRLIVRLVTLALLSPITATAQSGINLSWDDCGAHGVELETFACNTNSGVDLLVISAAVSPALPQVSGVQVVLDLTTSGATLSPWWHFESTGCRPFSLTARQDFSAFSNCFDLWTADASAGVGYTPAFHAIPNLARVVGGAGIPGSRPTPDGAEMYLLGFTIGHQKTVGTGSCSGCGDAACFVLESVEFLMPPGVGDLTLTNALARNTASWRCEGSFGTDMPTPCTVSCPVPAVKPSWGVIKSLYR